MVNQPTKSQPTRSPQQTSRTLANARQLIDSYCKDGLAAFRDAYCRSFDQQLLSSTLQQRGDLNAALNMANKNFSKLESKYLFHDQQSGTLGKQPEQVDVKAEKLCLESKEATELNTLFTRAINRQNSRLQSSLFALKLRRDSAVSSIKSTEKHLLLSPEELLEPFKRWLNECELPHQGAYLLAGQFVENFFKELHSLYEELNQQFIDAGILPNFKPRAKRREDTGKTKDELNDAESSADSKREDLYDSYTRQAALHTQLAPNPAQRKQVIDQSQPILSKNQLLNLIREQEQRYQDPMELSLALGRLNSNVRETQYALDCVGYFLDTLEEDSALAPNFKAEIKSIHAPLMRLALVDESFLSNPQHVARELIETIVDYCEFWDVDGEQSQLNSNIESDVQRIVEHIRVTTPIEDPKNHPFYISELETLIERLQVLERRAALSILRQEERFIGEQKLIAKRFIAKEFIRNRIKQYKLPRPVLEFLDNEWADVLAYALIQDDANSSNKRKSNQSWPRYSILVEKLVELIQPETDETVARSKSESKHGLFTKVREGLQAISLAPPRIEKLVSMLDTCSRFANENAEQLLAPDNDAGSQKEQIFSNVTQPVEPSSDNNIDTKALRQIRRLDPGSYLRMQTSAGNWALLKVIKTSPKTNSLLISTKNGIQVGTYQFDELALKLQQSQLQIVVEQGMDLPLFERMFARFAGKAPTGRPALQESPA